MKRGLTPLIAVAFVVLPFREAVRSFARQQPPVIVDLLSRYERGDLRAVLEAASPAQLASELVKHGEKWVDAASPDVTPRRRLTAATFGLELAGRTPQIGFEPVPIDLTMFHDTNNSQAARIESLKDDVRSIAARAKATLVQRNLRVSDFCLLPSAFSCVSSI